MLFHEFFIKTTMGDKTQYQLTHEQANRAIKMCLDNAWSYLKDADMYISNNKTEHLAIPIEFALEEIGKAKIIFDKIDNNSKILLSYKDGIYDHIIKIKRAVSLIELDAGEKIAESLALGFDEFDYLFVPSAISVIVEKEIKLKNTGKKGHEIRLASSFVDFDSATNEPKIEKSSGELDKLIRSLYKIIREYPSSFQP